MRGTARAFIGLGSNLGDRLHSVAAALQGIAELPGTRLEAVSALYETDPVGVEGRSFINAVAAIQTTLEPVRLMEALLDLETALGRPRPHGRNLARVIDLDLLLHGESVLREEGLILPHPRMLQRRFVMEPLAELDGKLEIPLTGRTAGEVARQLQHDDPGQKVLMLGRLEEIMEERKGKGKKESGG